MLKYVYVIKKEKETRQRNNSSKKKKIQLLQKGNTMLRFNVGS